MKIYIKYIATAVRVFLREMYLFVFYIRPAAYTLDYYIIITLLQGTLVLKYVTTGPT